MLSSEFVSIYTYVIDWSNSCLIQNLNKLAELVRGELPSLIRKIIGALITLDVHSRDVVTQMVQNKVLIIFIITRANHIPSRILARIFSKGCHMNKLRKGWGFHLSS